MCILSNSLAVRNYVRVRVLRLASRVPVHACRALQRTFVNALTGTREKKREKEREKETGWDYRWFSSWCFLPAVSWTWPREQGEEGKDVRAWRERETRRRGKRSLFSLRMSPLSVRLVHNLLLQSRVESRRRIFSGLLSFVAPLRLPVVRGNNVRYQR